MASGRRALELTAETQDLDLFGAATLIQTEIDRITCPPGYGIKLGHSFEEMKESRREILFAVLLALVLIYMIMAALFESFRTPLLVICSVPMALVGIVTALWLTGYVVSVAVYVGALALAGIVVNNAIVLVDHINRLRAKGLGYYRAVLQGSQDRLRPILITSVTGYPGAVAHGPGARRGHADLVSTGLDHHRRSGEFDFPDPVYYSGNLYHNHAATTPLFPGG